MDGVATSYTYDGYNNRIGKVENGVQTSYLYDNRNRLTRESFTKNGQTTVTSYQYDPNGNLYSKQTLTYGDNTIQTPEVSAVLMGYTADTNDMLLEYNNFNQLTTITKGDEIVTYDYYANGMRKSKTVDGYTTTHIWDGQNMAGEITGDDFIGYLRGNRLIARQMGDNTQYYHFNGHGDTLSTTDENGVVLQNYTYDAFGNLENPHGLDTNPFRYCGEYYDTETGFIYLRARYYAPEIGRFISEDPVRDGLNWYAYCENNPVMFVDPTGESKTVDLGSGWSYRIDNGQNGQQHIHVDGPNGQSYSRNADGTPHDGSEGKPPKWVQDKINEKIGKKGPWKWDKNDSSDNNGNSSNDFSNNTDSKSSSEDKSNNSNVSEAVSTGLEAGVALYVTYQVLKWAIATIAAPYTGGSSYAAAGAMP